MQGGVVKVKQYIPPVRNEGKSNFAKVSFADGNDQEQSGGFKITPRSLHSKALDPPIQGARAQSLGPRPFAGGVIGSNQPQPMNVKPFSGGVIGGLS